MKRGKRNVLALGCGLVIAALATGCGRAKEVSIPEPDTAKANAQPAGKAGPRDQAEAEVTVRIESWDGIQKWVSKQKQVVVVDLWSTWCPPCVREFPHFVELHHELGDQVRCVSVSLDYYGGTTKPQDSLEKVLQFLKARKATTVNFLSSDPDQEVLKKIAVSAVPVCLVFDGKGVLRKAFHNEQLAYGKEGFSYPKHVVPFVKSLLP